ncbi:acetyl-CoA C-acetyltransferase [Egibacter rhizosphaerae]|uniref:Probable acetyl-CoA acetyltransferase n=1 Tax=Egibacter rhizosphaerae TaxID=1670831 RepID=A0A411YD81_9ACTN|nr:acetyl-CoA C-acetyltransferase [Egibacter rhizosphaerae]QBI19107.1 acetyl-CoA C-acetyltransferase [Egibacter rhizosphaerae]
MTADHPAVDPRREPVLLGYARTPIGRLGGAFAGLAAVDLGGRAIASALERAGVPADRVDQVLMGHVLQAGQGQITARQAAQQGGIGMNVPATTINKVCLSGMSAVALADQQIRLGEASVVVAGGMESMSQAPYLLPDARFGYRMGDGKLVDAMVHDGLWCAFDDAHMGATSDAMNARYGIDRAVQDEWAARSHERAATATKEGRFEGEVVPVEIPQRRGEPEIVTEDEGVRPGTTTESLGKLKPAFAADGTITAGNASQISDGAAALVVASRAVAEELGATPVGRIRGYGTVAGPDPSLHHQPAEAIRLAAEKAGVAPDGLEVYEINEAFAAVAKHSTDLLGVDEARVNPHGGAVAVGHPIGASGARITAAVLHQLAARGGGFGAAALCGGGGQGDALLLEVG